MSHHLSEDQFAKRLAGQSTSEELQHIKDCPECSAELGRFSSTIALFRDSIRDRVDVHVASQPVYRLPLGSVVAIPRLRWALIATATVVLALLPFLAREPEQQEVADAEALMDAVSQHLSRTIPAPMEPMMALIPSDESATESGGIE